MPLLHKVIEKIVLLVKGIIQQQILQKALLIQQRARLFLNSLDPLCTEALSLL